MGLISDIIGGSFGSTVSAVGDTLKKFITTDGDRMQAQKELEQILQKRDTEIEQTIRVELGAKERVIVAELQHGDTYTKRARPTVVYVGLGAILFNYCFVPLVQTLTGTEVQAFALPMEFWAAWGGIVATWSIGRSAEKRGARKKVTSFITGSKY